MFLLEQCLHSQLKGNEKNQLFYVQFSCFFSNYEIFSLIYIHISATFRYIVICHPLKTWLHFGKVRTIAVIIWIWVISIVFSVAWTNFASVSKINMLASVLIIFVATMALFYYNYHGFVLLGQIWYVQSNANEVRWTRFQKRAWW